jgi:hypothetical protein
MLDPLTALAPRPLLWNHGGHFGRAENRTSLFGAEQVRDGRGIAGLMIDDLEQ